MATKNYTTKTAALSATTADMRKVQVSKKIEIGSGDTATKITKDEVSAEDLLIGVDVKNEETGETTHTRQSVKALIDDVSTKVDNMKMGIEVGSDASEKDPNDNVKAFESVSKLNFRGSYVTVVEDPVTKEITLWINESTAYPEYNDISRTDGTNPGTTVSVKAFSDNTYAIPGGSGSTVNAYIPLSSNKLQVDDTKYGTSIYKLRNTDGNPTFRISSAQAFFIRSVYETTEGAWQKVSFGTAQGKAHDVDNEKVDVTDKVSTPFVSGSAVTPTAVTGISLSYSVRPFADADAPLGRAPQTAEAEITITVDWDALLTKDGGTARIEYAFDSNTKTAPDAGNIKALVSDTFFTECKKPSCTFSSITYKSKTQTANAVSGLKYNTSGSVATIGITGITNSQWKVAATDGNRLSVSAAGKTSTVAVGSLTRTDSTGVDSSAVFSYTGDVTLGSTGEGTAEVKVTPLGIAATISGTSSNTNGTVVSKTLPTFWGTVAENSGKTKEEFGKETYRLVTPTTAYSADTLQPTTAYPNATSVDDASVLTSIPAYNNGATLCQAVCQYNKLKHPNAAEADANGKKYNVDMDAVFIRRFNYTNENKLTITGTNLSKADAVYFFDGMTWWNVKVPIESAPSVHTQSGDTIYVNYSTDHHRPIGGTQPLIAVVLGKSNTNAIDYLEMK